MTRSVLRLAGVVGCALACMLAMGPTAGAGLPDRAPHVRTERGGVPRATTRLHFIVNRDGSNAPRKLGYNVFDTDASRRAVRALPRRVKALVWLGQKCPTTADAGFRRTVRALSRMHRVLGYYLSDEPHIGDCPGGPAALATRTRFIDRVSDGRQKSFAVLSEDEDFHPFRPAVTGLDLVGLDPYPCSEAHPACDLKKIDREVRVAHRKRIPLRRMVPVYQVFGQGRTTEEYYHLPRPHQLRRMLTRWRKVLPSPPMDYSYGWGHQSSANPTLVDAPRLRRLLKSFFAG